MSELKRDTEPTYYHLLETPDSFILNDRMEVKWKEIWLYPIPLFALIYILTGNNLFIALLFGLLFGLLYLLFRYLAWMLSMELQINKKDASLSMVRKVFNKTRSTRLVDKKFDLSSINFEKKERSGKTKFILFYQKHEPIPILVVKNEADKDAIHDWFKKISDRLPIN